MPSPFKAKRQSPEFYVEQAIRSLGGQTENYVVNSYLEAALLAMKGKNARRKKTQDNPAARETL
jgi:hypothetical protein